MVHSTRSQQRQLYAELVPGGQDRQLQRRAGELAEQLGAVAERPQRRFLFSNQISLDRLHNLAASLTC